MNSPLQTLGMMLAEVVLTGTVLGQSFRREVADLLAGVKDTAPEVVTEADLDGLP